MRGRWIATGMLVLVCCAGTVFAQPAPADTGRIAGRVVQKEQGVGGVVILIAELKRTDVTDESGAFSFDKVPPGKYTLLLTHGNDSMTREDVFVTGGRTHELTIEVDWDLGVSEKVTVTAAAQAAKIVDAPAAVTSIPEEQIERQASHGQVPKILEFTPGAEVTQSGLYDFNFNTRGFNSSLNRRVSTYIDGRDVGVVLLGAQEWAAISGELDDIANLEFVRGPSAALYGANASSGVINITTKAPHDSQGTMVRLSGGVLNTLQADAEVRRAVDTTESDAAVNFRTAGGIGHDWYYKVTAGARQSGDFTVARNPDVVDQPEYSEFCMLIGETDCLPEEKPLFQEQNDKTRFASLRFDKYLPDGSLMTFEVGQSNIEGPVFQTGIGRVQVRDVKRPFFRYNWSNSHWNVLAHFTSRRGDQANLTKALQVNYQLLTDDQRYGVEAQRNWHFADGRGRLVVGAAHTEERVDTWDDATQRQTVLYQKQATNRQAVFSQFDWRANKHVQFVFAGRIDRSTLHDTQFSPKAALVYSINPKNSFRFTYNQAFQVANYSEFFLHTRISAFPIGGFVRQICGSPALPQPVDCGIEGDFIPILAVGNDDLQLEKTAAFEVGYSGLWANRVFVTVDYYNANNQDFITDLVPQVGTVLGNTENCVDRAGVPTTDPKKCPINPDYKPWVGPDEAENTYFTDPLTGLPIFSVAQALRNAVDNSVGGNTLGFRLGQDLDGGAVVVARTYTNVGKVKTQGIDLGIQYFVTEALAIQASYSWFDFHIVDVQDEDVADILLPNTPAHKASMSVSYSHNHWALSLAGRWVDSFRWSAGVFQGPVDAYSTMDLTANYRVNKHVSVGLNVANLRDNVRRQTFGGDLLHRRALTNLTLAW